MSIITRKSYFNDVTRRVYLEFCYFSFNCGLKFVACVKHLLNTLCARELFIFKRLSALLSLNYCVAEFITKLCALARRSRRIGTQHPPLGEIMPIYSRRPCAIETAKAPKFASMRLIPPHFLHSRSDDSRRCVRWAIARIIAVIVLLHPGDNGHFSCGRGAIATGMRINVSRPGALCSSALRVCCSAA